MTISTGPAINAPSDSYARIRQPRLVSWIRIIGVVICLLWLILNVWNIPNDFQQSMQVSGDSTLAPGFVRLQISPEVYVAGIVGLASIQVIAACLVALFIVWKRPSDPVAILMVIGLLGVAMQFPRSDQPILYFLYNATASIGLGAVFPIICVFPNGKITPRWLRLLIWPYLFFTLIYWFVPIYEIDSSLGSLNYLILALFWCLGLWFQLQRLRRTENPVERQQLKQVVAGTSVAVTGAIINEVMWSLVLPTVSDPAIKLLILFFGRTLFYGGLLVLLVALTLAIFRLRLWNIDLAINRGMVYGGLAIGLGAVFFVALVVLQSVLQRFLGSQQTTIAAMISAGGVVALFNPVRRWLQSIVDRRVFKLRFDLNQVRALDNTHERAEHPSPLASDGLVGKTLGAYKLGKLLGEGGMGQIYLGEQSALARKVAIKVLPTRLSSEATFRARFEREAQIVAGLHHANIVNVFDYGEADGTYFIIMEYIEGDDCENALRKNKTLPLDQAIPLIQKLASALDYAHEQGLVHRDVKPANVMLRGYQGAFDGVEPILMDFGLVKLIDSHSGLTQTGALGTIAYMAPEQIIAAGTVDHRADIYAFGIMCYELLTGSLPFPNDNMAQMVFAHLQQPPRDPRDILPDLPIEVADALLWTLQKTPELRPQTAGAFAAKLVATSAEEASYSEMLI